ncbi:MAG: MFS transporter [Gibbsiella quercinecans]|uniref:MFS transporter n=1 Tax=Gibbsiella quercinecans TaxID=929813 RepID=UPI003F3F891C
MNMNKTDKIRKIQRFALFLLIIIGIVNYMDRATLSIANHAISEELGLTKVHMGYLLSAFSLTYAFLQLPVGAFLDRLGSRILLGLGLLLWSAAQLAGGIVHSFKALFFTRLILGVGEAPQFPAAAKSISEWYNIKERGRAMGTFNSSAAMGTAIAPPVLTALMLLFSWRWMFIIMGALGIVLSLIWLFAYRNRNQVELTKAEVAYLDDGAVTGSNEKITTAEWFKIFKSSSTWGILLGFMGIVYMIWLFLTWLPAYLAETYDISLVNVGWMVSIPYIFAILGSISAGFISDYFVSRGYDMIKSRKSLVALGLIMAGIFIIPAAYATTVTQAIIFISIAQFSIQLASGSSWILVSSIIPSNRTASLGGIQNFGGYIAGSIAPILTGYMAQSTGSFTSALIVAAVIAIASAIAHFVLVRNPIVTGNKSSTTPVINPNA